MDSYCQGMKKTGNILNIVSRFSSITILFALLLILEEDVLHKEMKNQWNSLARTSKISMFLETCFYKAMIYFIVGINKALIPCLEFITIIVDVVRDSFDILHLYI